MPARPPVANVIEIDFLHTSDQDTTLFNRFFFSYTGSAPTAAQMATLVTNSLNHWATNVQKYQSNEWVLTSGKGIDLTSSTGAEAIIPSGVAGTAVAASSAYGSAMVISHKISRRYRGGHPRTYLGGFPYDQITDGRWSSAEIANITTGFAAFITAMLAESWSGGSIVAEVNVSYYQGFTNHTYPSGRVRPIPNLRPTPVVDVITAFLVHNAVASQRRRNPPS